LIHSSIVVIICIIKRQLSLDQGVVQSYGLTKRLSAVQNCRNISKKDMILNDLTPDISGNSFKLNASNKSILWLWTAAVAQCPEVSPGTLMPSGR
jgi:urease alpha subunit